jgi:hypothetical protein
LALTLLTFLKFYHFKNSFSIYDSYSL